MKHVGQQVDLLLAFGGSDDTLRILPHIGFKAAGLITGYARPLFPLKIVNGDTRFRWRLLPRLARNIAWKLTAPRGESGAWRANAVTDDLDMARIADCLPKAVAGTPVLERSLEQLRYTLGCPMVRTALYAMQNAQRAEGYFMLAFAPGQVRIVDCWMSSSDPTDWRAMLCSAIAQARQERGAAEVVLWTSSVWQRGILQSCGFRARFDLPVRIRAVSRMTVTTVGLNVQMLDNDAAYLHEGVGTHWI